MANETIELPISVLKEALKKIFKKAEHAHADLLSEVLVKNLSLSETGLVHTYLALSGTRLSLPFLPGDEIKINIKELHSWTVDIPAMRTAGLITIDDCVKGTITKVDPYMKANIFYKFERICNGKQEFYTDNISHSKISVDETCKIRNDIAEKL